MKSGDNLEVKEVSDNSRGVLTKEGVKIVIPVGLPLPKKGEKISAKLRFNSAGLAVSGVLLVK